MLVFLLVKNRKCEWFIFNITELINLNTVFKTEYTPFLKVKYTNKQIDYENEIKELNKQLVR